MFKRALIFLIAITFVVTINSALAKMLERQRPKLPTKEQRVEKIQARVTELTKKLNLTEEQRKKIWDILAKSKEATIKLLEDTGDKIADIKIKSESDIEEVLSQEQRDKLHDISKDEEDDVLKIFKGSY